MTPGHADRLNGWGKILAALLPLILVAMVVGIKMTVRMDAAESALTTKASKELVEFQYQVIKEQLDRIEQKVDAKP